MRRLTLLLAVLLLIGCASKSQAPRPDIDTPPPPGESSPLPWPGSPDTQRLLLDPNRKNLAICVQVDEQTGVDPALVQETVQSALNELGTKDLWKRRGFGFLENRVDLGCPSEPYLLKPGVRRMPGGWASVPTPFVEESSPYLVFLFVLPQTDVERVFQDTLDRISFQEYLRQGDSAIAVTIGLYFSPSEITAEHVKRGLSQALQL